MRRFVIVVLFLAAIVVMSGSATHAHHGAPYSANVKEGLRWVKEHTTDRGFRYAYRLWENESGWAVHAGTLNTCYGIPQACPGWKMIEAFPRALWRAQAQVKWGTRYVRARYGTFRRALAHQNAHGWY
jgi:hypothetical protein